MKGRDVAGEMWKNRHPRTGALGFVALGVGPLKQSRFEELDGTSKNFWADGSSQFWIWIVAGDAVSCINRFSA